MSNHIQQDPLPKTAVASPPKLQMEVKAVEEQRPTTPLEQTTLVHNEEESFALAPVDASVLRGKLGHNSLVCSSVMG